MDAKSLRHYVKHNPALKSWLKANEDWFRAHPQALESMLNNPTFLNAFSHNLQKKGPKLQRRLHRVNNRTSSHVQPTSKTKFSFPSLSTLNQKLSQTSEFIHTIQSFLKK